MAEESTTSVVRDSILGANSTGRFSDTATISRLLLSWTSGTPTMRPNI